MAINSKSKLRDILDDPRAVAIIEEYKPGFSSDSKLGPVMGMRMNLLINFPQSGFSSDQKKEITAKLDALDDWERLEFAIEGDRIPMLTVAVQNYIGIEVKSAQAETSAKKTEDQMKDEIMDKILDINDIAVPQDLVDNEFKMMVMEYKYRTKYKNMASGGYLDLIQEDMSDMLDGFKRDAFKLVKTKLVLTGIMEAEKIEVTKEELQAEAEAISVRQKMPIEMVRDFLGEDMKSLKVDLMARKTIDFVFANAVIK